MRRERRWWWWWGIALGRECFSAGSSWFYVTVKALIFQGHDEALHFDFFFFFKSYPNNLALGQISEMKVWKQPVRVSRGVKRSQTQGPGPYLHDADSTKWKISGNYRLAFWPCRLGKSKKKKKAGVKIESEKCDSSHCVIKRGVTSKLCALSSCYTLGGSVSVLSPRS